jgi:hypothetical protein
VVQAFGHRVASASATMLAQVAKDSFSQRSSHQVMVTRSPNHIWASSCSKVSALDSRRASVTRDLKMKSSRMVTAPAFSIAPALNSGTKIWSYLVKGYGRPNAPRKKSNPCRVNSKISSASRYVASDCRQARPSGTPSCSVRAT